MLTCFQLILSFCLASCMLAVFQLFTLLCMTRMIRKDAFVKLKNNSVDYEPYVATVGTTSCCLCNEVLARF